ncbi:hypothetical protein B0A50_06836 [Salinomyces thailandicus]|uniref:phosphatidylserine decarboxylase n=1 Tax=Salinomyces thailandicus TaxID=706561 RepID=A0A4U0TQD2_9PEZI|nr:hypothetical protein B0A50_06836 [Salinomyces thailandica]
MASDTSTDTSPVDDDLLSAVSTSLEELTAQASHSKDRGIHIPANHEKAGRSFWRDTVHEKAAESHLGNYVVDRATGEKTWEPMSIYVRLGMHLLYYGSEQEKALHWDKTRQLLKEQSEKLGRQYDSPESKRHIRPFIDDFGLQHSLSDMLEPDPEKYATFNEFFAREIRPNARPIAEPATERCVSSPADCRLTAFPTVSLATKYWIKGMGFSLAKLLGAEATAKRFDGGSILIARLAPQDYHRWHCPITGTVESINEIPGAYYTVNPQAINEEGSVDVFTENRRSVMMLRRALTGSSVAVIAVGAMLVGSIKYNHGIQPSAKVRRGQCLGAFYYGGSTVIVLYPRGEVVLDEDLVRNSCEQKCETLVRFGCRVGAGPR